MNKRLDKLPGKVITILFMGVWIVFIGLLLYTRMFPLTYILIAAVLLVLLTVIIGALVWRMRRRVRFWTGTVLAALLVIVMSLGSMYMYQTISALGNISGVNTQTAHVGLYVRNEDAAQSIADTAGYTYGILQTLDRENTDAAIQAMGTDVGASVQVAEYAGLPQLVDGLLNGETGGIILNTAYLDIIAEMEQYADIHSRIREVGNKQVETAIEQTAPVQGVPSEKQEDHIMEVFISGIDTRGGMTANSRSDVNILATVNLDTREVLLVSTPRDYFVPLSISGGIPDKLTHAGIYGVDVSMDTLGMLYGVNVDHYFRVNFGGFVDIINALGGITVHSDYEFVSSEGGYYFSQGENYVDGDQALAFARERQAFAEGDRQRGKNQMALIESVINKALSPDLLMNYSSVLSGVEGSFETNIPYDTIAELVRTQLSEGGSWNIQSYSVDGTGDTQQPYSMSQAAYVMIPDQTTVDTAKSLMQQVRAGEHISVE